MTNAISIAHVSHTYPAQRKSAKRTALVDISLDVSEGMIYGLLGPNGGGKSTLFRILSTALVPTEGNIQMFGVNIVADPAQVRRFFGVVFQHPALDKQLTVEENLIHHGHLYGLSGASLKEKIAINLDRLSLSPRTNDIVQNLSGGLQRRVEIAKGLLHTPRLLIMDEPSTGLDPSARKEMWDVLFSLKKAGVTILITTHLMEEGDKCDRLLILHQGHMVAEGSPSELKNKIGADVITIQTDNPQMVLDEAQRRWQCVPSLLNNAVRIEIRDGHKFIPELIEALPGTISSVQLGKPTLEDVFIHETGQSFSEKENAA